MGMVELGYISMTNLPSPSVKICQYLSLMYLSLYMFSVQANKCKPIVVGVIYLPNSHSRADLDLFMSIKLYIHGKISNKNKIAYLMGDYNINLLSFA